MTEPNDKQKQEAREIAVAWFAKVTQFEMRTEDLTTRVAAALSSRDREIREVLEGLSGGFRDGDNPCWCFDDKPPHSPACLAARALWERVQVKERENV